MRALYPSTIRTINNPILLKWKRIGSHRHKSAGKIIAEPGKQISTNTVSFTIFGKYCHHRLGR